LPGALLAPISDRIHGAGLPPQTRLHGASHSSIVERKCHVETT
jgi:hypothetical protein